MKPPKFISLCLSAGLLFGAALTSCEGGESASSSDGSGGIIGRGGSMARFTIAGDALYTVDSYTLKTFNITDPSNPAYFASKDQMLGSDIETIFAMDSLLFIGSQSGMYIYNVTRPEFPQQMSYVSHITSCDPVVASGNYAYVTLNTQHVRCGRNVNELQVYDISDPYHPRLVRTESGLKHPGGLGVDGNRLFVCDDGLKVYDVTKPEQPIWIDDLTHIPEAEGIDTYDVIPHQGILLLVGSDGFYQFRYDGERLVFLSKIEVSTPQ
jgi:hypothetical protein